MNSLSTAIKFFQDCGLFIYPSLLIMATGVAIAIERFIFLQRARSANRAEWTKVLPMLQGGQWKDVLGRTAASDSAIGKIVHNGLTRLQSSRRRQAPRPSRTEFASIRFTFPNLFPGDFHEFL